MTIRIIIIVISAFCCFGCSSPHPQATAGKASYADTNDQWETYLNEYAGGKGSVLVNMSLKKMAPAKEYPYVLITGVKFSKCEEGLPAQAAFADLYTISDSVKDRVYTNFKALLAGTFTHECRRLDYYYLSDTSGVRAMLTRMYVLAFPGYEASISIKADSEWDAYLKLLYPNEAMMQYIQDEKVIYNLLQAGDDPSAPRPIDYGFYFASSADRDCFITYALANRYTIVSKGNAEGDMPYELTIAKRSAVLIDSIYPIGQELIKQANKCNGDYDGWGAEVVK